MDDDKHLMQVDEIDDDLLLRDALMNEVDFKLFVLAGHQYDIDEFEMKIKRNNDELDENQLFIDEKVVEMLEDEMKIRRIESMIKARRSEIMLKQHKIQQLNLDKIQSKRIIDQLKLDRNKILNEISELNYEISHLPININKLPVEMFQRIFKSLTVRDLWNCQFVCSSWFYIVRNLFDSLVVTDSPDIRRNERWTFSNRLCSKSHLMNLSEFVALGTGSRDTPFVNLKQLKIMHEDVQTKIILNSIEFINRLTGLEVIEIRNPILVDKSSTISLENLHTLEIEVCLSELDLQTPKLAYFKNRYGLSNIQFFYPDTITHLYLSIDNLSCDLRIELFENLQFLFIESFIYCSDEFIADLSLKIHGLRFLKMFYIGNNFPSCDYESLKQMILFNLQLKQLLNRTQLELIFFGIKLTDAKQLNDYSFNDDLIRLHLINGNWSKLDDDLRWIKRVNYNSAIKNSGFGLPVDFHHKLNDVEEVIVNGVVNNQEQLFDFLNGFRCLNTLNIRNAALSNQFYDRLATNFKCIHNLIIEENADVIDNFEFILNFEDHSTFEINKEVPLEIISQVNRTKNEFSFQILYKANLVTIRKTRSSFLLINRLPTYFTCLEKLLERLERM